MSILPNQPPPYSEAQVINNVVGVSASEANLQQSILNLATQDPSLTQNLQLQTDVPHNPEDAANFDTYKQNIYRHPLFPLLAMVFEKCENATYSPDAASHTFEKELQAFMKHHEGLKTPVLGSDVEVNELMIKAIQVLRIHLMEVEKVNDLCKDFCTRYISCLKAKLTSEQLLHVDGCDSPEPQDLSLGQASQNVVSLSSNMQMQQPPLVTPTVVGGSVVLQQQQQQQQPQPQIVSGNTVYQMVHTPQGIVAQPIQIQGPLTPLNQPVQQVIHGSTPLSQIGVSLTSPTQQPQPQNQQHPVQQAQQLPQQHGDIKPMVSLHRGSDDDDDDKNSKQKRGILPKHATQVMKSWLFQHIVHPYPTEDEKRQIASQTNLTLLQVNNWFINARRRILQPMLEASNPDKAKTKKPSKPGNKPQQRFWPIQSTGIPKEEKVDGEEPKSKVPPPHSPKKAAAAASNSAASNAVAAAERLQQQIIATDAGAFNQQEALLNLGLMSSAGLVLKLSPDGQIVPSNQLVSSTPPSISLENLQALQSSGFVFAPGPTPLPFNLPLSALSPSTGAGLGLGVGPFSNLTSPMSLNALNFAASGYSTPLQQPMFRAEEFSSGRETLLWNDSLPDENSSSLNMGRSDTIRAGTQRFANCINAAPIDLSTVSNSAPLQLSTFSQPGGATSQVGNAGQLFMGISQETNGDQNTDDAEENLEAGELKIDTRDVRSVHDVGEG